MTYLGFKNHWELQQGSPAPNSLPPSSQRRQLMARRNLEIGRLGISKPVTHCGGGVRTWED